jgi:hypothetical protein
MRSLGKGNRPRQKRKSKGRISKLTKLAYLQKIDRVIQIIGHKAFVHVINNHYGGKDAASALQLIYETRKRWLL